MEVGDTFEREMLYHDGGYTSQRKKSNHVFRVIKIYQDGVNEKKDLFLCEEDELGYRECFHRMDLEGCK